MAKLELPSTFRWCVFVWRPNASFVQEACRQLNEGANWSRTPIKSTTNMLS